MFFFDSTMIILIPAIILTLSKEIYYGKSVAAQGIVAHEIGHALQDAKNYFPLSLRSNLVPITNIGSGMAVPLFLIGFIFSFPVLMDIGIIAFSLAVLFQLVTLPVEFNASKRAVNLLVGANIVSDTEEINAVKKVLNAAAFTYVAATSVAVFQLLRLIVLRNRR